MGSSRGRGFHGSKAEHRVRSPRPCPGPSGNPELLEPKRERLWVLESSGTIWEKVGLELALEGAGEEEGGILWCKSPAEAMEVGKLEQIQGVTKSDP